MISDNFVDFFRQASPYINAHRGKTIVVYFGGEAILDEQFAELIHDIALLNSLGCRLVLVHGARQQIDQRLKQAGICSEMAGDVRITDEAAVAYVKEAVGSARIRVEARLSMGLANSPMHGAGIRVVSGNFVTARPIGVRDGVDFGFAGTVRRVDAEAISRWLDSGAIVLLSPLGYSPTGETFNLTAEDVAAETARAVRADKLLLLYEGADLENTSHHMIRQMSPADARKLLDSGDDLPLDMQRHLERALRACAGGVRRTHLLRRDLDGGLLLELFTRDGVGTMLTGDKYEGVRPASIDDVGGVLELIRPLEQTGALVRRSRELLEVEIDRFAVVERDGAVIGCAALYAFAQERVGELACLAVDPEYQRSGRAEALLHFIENEAAKKGLQRLFVLTTQTAHWFQERGFQPTELADLPVTRQQMYNIQRRSKVFIKAI